MNGIISAGLRTKKMQKIKANMLVSSCLGLLAISMPLTAAHAQELEEIIVTAQKRAQNLQEVPLSITAFSSQQIRDLGLSRPLDVGYQVPGIVLKSVNGDSSPIFTVRGIGLTDFTASNNSATSIYIDQVVKPYYPLVNFSLFDIERVEVLKGPQGTLYGRNNTGGAVKFITRKPTSIPEAFMRMDYGNYDTFELEGAIGGAITNSLNARLSGFTRQRGTGYQYNNISGERNGKIDRLAGRLALAWKASDNLDVDLVVYAGRNKSDVPQFKLSGPFNPAFLPVKVVCAAAALGNRAYDGSCVDSKGHFDPDPNVNHVQSANVQGDGLKEDGQGGALTMNLDLSDVILTSVTGFDHQDRLEKQDFDGTPTILVDNSFTQHINSFSQELRVASSPSSPVQWIGGVFYSKDKLENTQIIRADALFGVPLGGARIAWAVRTESYAGFGQIEVPLADKFTAIGGLRYSHEKRSFIGGSSSFPFAFLPTIQVNNETSASDLSGKIGLNFKPEKNRLFYVSASKGFKSGGFNGAFATNPIVYQPYGPERLYAYEAGFKSTLFENRVRFNAAVYHYDWRSFQATITTTDPLTGLPVQRLTNAGNARVNGIEAELYLRPVNNLNLSLSAAYADGKVVSGQLNGLQLANSPKFSLNGTARYEQPVNALDGSLFLQSDFSFRTSYNTRLLTATTRPLVTQDAFWLVNGRLGYKTSSDRIELAAWVKNIFDQKYLLDVFDQGTINSLDLYAEPRTYGLSLTYKFL